MKRALAIALSILMMLTLSVNIFADEGIPVDEPVENTDYGWVYQEFTDYISVNYSDNENNGKPVSECPLVGDWYSDKFATNWKNSSSWNWLMIALSIDDSVLRIKCDGNVTRLGFQSDLANCEMPVECVDGVVTVSGTELLATCADALADGYSWCNFIISGDAGTVINEISLTYTDIVVLESATEEEPEGEITVEEAEIEVEVEEEPADTGLALAVVPMIVAAAAVALFKKR